MHLLSIPIATIAAFMAGGLWYGPLFGKAWQAEQGFTEADKARSSMVTLFATTLVCEAIVALFVSFLLHHFPHDPNVTIMVAISIAVGFVIPTMLVNHSYGLKSVKLMAIDAGHWLVVFVVIGVVFAVLRA